MDWIAGNSLYKSSPCNGYRYPFTPHNLEDRVFCPHPVQSRDNKISIYYLFAKHRALNNNNKYCMVLS